uniref:RNA 3'-terminal phosphate cyclase domain-containing protein n=1 Tax=Heterosigma akashiwo TaxID=2829 RepID=A0A7S4D566_HETAK
MSKKRSIEGEVIGKTSALKTNKKKTSNSVFMTYRGCANFRQRLVFSTLSGRPIKIRDIRAEDDDQPGLKSFEASFLRLLEKLTNGCKIEINETGTFLSYRPGFIRGGRVEHDCGSERAIGWFLEGILPLAPFCKDPFNITFTGITNDHVDTSVDVLKNVTLPMLKHFGIEGNLSIQIQRRGAPPSGGGRVAFRCPRLRELRPCAHADPGRVKRVRGVAYSAKVSPQTANRCVAAARALLNRLLPDVYVYTDHYKGKEAGAAPGFALALVAETTTGALLSAEVCAEKGALPEDLGAQGSRLLLEEVKHGGCVDRAHQPLWLALMALGPEDVSRARLGATLTPAAVQTLRLLRDFFGVVFKIKPAGGRGDDPAAGGLLLSCLGAGFKNINRRVS